MEQKELKEGLDKCVRCGRCLSVCPVYSLTQYEGSVCRGKLALLRAELEGEADLESRMKDLLSHCLQCGACAEECASGVDGDDLIRIGRTLAMGDKGLDGLRGLLARDVMGRGVLTRGLWKVKNLFLKNVPEDSGLHFRFPVPFLEKERYIPRPADHSFLESVKDRPTPHAGRPRAALFVGCVSNYINPSAARAAVDIMEAAGADVVIPLGQVCCGKPASAAGDDKSARHAAEKNLKALNPDDFDFLVTFCATCSERLKHYADLPDPRGRALADKVRDFSEFLRRDLDWRPDGTGDFDPVRVFYHDPCHLRRKQGVHKEPREILSALPGVTLVGADERPVCCGYGGVFNLWHYDLSRKLFKVRAASITPHQPDLVVTSCSGCWLQFEDVSRQIGRPFEIKPLTELVSERALGPGR